MSTGVLVEDPLSQHTPDWTEQDRDHIYNPNLENRFAHDFGGSSI